MWKDVLIYNGLLSWLNGWKNRNMLPGSHKSKNCFLPYLHIVVRQVNIDPPSKLIKCNGSSKKEGDFKLYALAVQLLEFTQL